MLFEYCNDTVECIAIHVKQLNAIFVGIYRPPDCTSALFNPVLKKLEAAVDELSSPVPEIHLMGDFYFPFVKWKTTDGVNIGTVHSGGLTDEQMQFKSLTQFAEKYLLSQIIDEPTRKSNVLELCYTNNQDVYHTIKIHEVSRSFSDHNIIMMETKYVCQEENNHEMISYINTTVLTICSKFVPLSSKVRKRWKNKIPKYNRYLMRRRTRINERLENMPASPQKQKLVKENYDIEQKIRNIHKEKKKSQEHKATEAIKNNSKLFFSYANKLS
jgi:hypothetical protein